MKYDDFINEIKGLHTEALTLFDKEEIHSNSDFRNWKHKLTASIDLIEDQGYTIKCDIGSRLFTNLSQNPSSRLKHYNMELQDTINELDTIIKYYNNYGSPKINSKEKSNNELKWPKTVTLSWLFKHAPIGFWVGAISLLFGAYIAGIQSSQLNFVKEIFSFPQETATQEYQELLEKIYSYKQTIGPPPNVGVITEGLIGLRKYSDKKEHILVILNELRNDAYLNNPSFSKQYKQIIKVVDETEKAVESL